MSPPTNDQADVPRNIASRRAIRWWPVPLIFLAATGGIVWVWQAYGRQRQDKNLASVGILLLTLLLLLLWCLLLSRIRWKLRLRLFGGVVGLVLIVAALFRIQGVTGDMVPILRWRWSHSAWIAPDGQTEPTSARLQAQLETSTNDYPQFLGPNRNATLQQPRLARDWKAEPPQRLWLQPVGAGWSGFSIAGNRTITQEQRGENETVNCYALLSGVPIWSYAYPAHFRSTLAGEPRGQIRPPAADSSIC
jgi:outer membrane protein assembly factor BamB